MPNHELGTTCGCCGVHHRVVASMPNRPFAAEDVDRLDRSCAFVAAVGATDGSRGEDDETSETSETDDGRSPDGSYETNTLVVSTAGGTRLLRRSDDLGWVVDRERDHDEREDPRVVGVDVFAEAAPRTRLSPTDARRVLDDAG
ncbi:hypothetical protein [Halomarina rubra]|uniref:DUF7964 domain-containing protein n=1 Tax=Halomarina rubra TaxID=2071873 RepID=A0ABD6B1E0_9EURY|nr:hypothetical protein [Halomarina rubra]